MLVAVDLANKNYAYPLYTRVKRYKYQCCPFLLVVIKVNLSSREAGNLQRLSERLNDLHGKAKPRSARVERAINQLIDRDIEILHSHMDRQAVLYFWCKSEKGHENLRTLCESKSIVDVIGDLTKNTSSAPEPVGSRMIDTDIYQFKKIFGKF